ncbi:hypothetical protein LZZ85_00610 [Terrimonas sp. NA20]|uniref:DUF1795 domain-containing protein n=1 Tax=Terrimonas ginsenosidimutans TaxID=2908004 RepID=A0ABS9KKB0_9BACT|nr:hypothetical protein [Terrimonas ginsenosidimutans]MCG2612751.1 hypothetical protein [Terrimonas ginsenosidimutans]
MQPILKPLLLCLFALFTSNTFSQKETYDLVSYTIPNKWQKQQHANGVQLSAGDEKKGTYSSIVILHSSPTNAAAQADFTSDWETLIKKTVTVSSAPSMLDPVENDGWKILTGTAPYTDGNSKGVTMLLTASGYNKKISIILVSNTDAHQQAVESFFASVDFIKPAVQKQAAPDKPITSTFKNGYKFTNTNFDNGWTAAEQSEGVMLTKGSIKALLHYPDEITEKYYPYSEDAVKTCWAHLVAGRYATVNNLKIYSQSSAIYNPAKMAEADVTDKVTGKSLYVVLFQRNTSYWTELIAPDRNTFIKQFNVKVAELEPMAPNNIFDVFSSLSDLNRFAIASSDLTGKWTSSSASNVAYANVYTGAYAGGTIAGSNHAFTFGPGSQYSSTHNGGSGTTGNVQTYKQSFKGVVTVTDWSVTLSKRSEGKTEKFDAWFVASKQGRILMLKNAATSYALIKAGK